jgi:hypothetical protein
MMILLTFHLGVQEFEMRNEFVSMVGFACKKINIPNLKRPDMNSPNYCSNTSDKDYNKAVVDTKQFRRANKSFVDQVRQQRLEQTRDLDKKEERDRI